MAHAHYKDQFRRWEPLDHTFRLMVQFPRQGQYIRYHNACTKLDELMLNMMKNKRLF